MEDDKILQRLGKRVERLLTIGLFIIIFCFAEVYLVTANTQISNNQSLVAVNFLLKLLEKDNDKLNLAFQERNKPTASSHNYSDTQIASFAATRKKLGLPANDYRKIAQDKEQEATLSYEQLLNDMAMSVVIKDHVDYAFLKPFIDPNLSPEDIAKKLSEMQVNLNKKPTTVWGIPTAPSLKIQYAGADYQLPYGFLSAALIAIITPIICGWLSALYLTRQREIYEIRRVADFKLSFPHVLNFVPVRFEAFHKPENEAAQPVVNFILAMTRVAVILVFIIPMILAIFYSLYELSNTDVNPWVNYTSWLFTAVIFIQTLSLIIQECTCLKGKLFIEKHHE